jgi:GAF domain-containing protein
MGEATLEHTLRDIAATLIADTAFADTIQHVVALSRDVVQPVVTARLELVDDRGRPTEELSTGASGGSGDAGDHLSAPLVTSGVTLGSLTLYARDSGAFTAADEAALEVFADQAAVVIANARAYWELHEVAAGLEAAMRSRAVIEQAKGQLMVREGMTADEAFALLARTSQRDNIKLRELARQVVGGEHDGQFARS